MRRFKLLYAIVYGVLIAVLAVSTVVSSDIYGSWWFMALWAAVGIGLIAFMVKLRLWRRPSLFILHASVVVILLGGAVTGFTAEEESLTLYPGRPVTRFGFTVELERFETSWYPGGTIPQNYCSHLKINGQPMALEVNKPLSVNGCRLYQQSYMPGGVSVISVRRDSVGTAVTFAGYALFLLGGLMCLRRRAKALAIIGIVALGASASVPVISDAAADSLARSQVVYQGRVCTFSTVAHDVMRKLYGKPSFAGLSPERVVVSLTAFPDEWNAQPVIKHGSNHISLLDCFDADGNYKMANDVQTDERVGIILLLRSGELFSDPGPEDPVLSAARVEAEILYNKVPSTLILFIMFFLASAGAFIRARVGRCLGWLALSLQCIVIAVECWLTGHGPFVSMFETLQLLVAAVALLALMVRGALAIGLLAAGCMALVAHLQASNPIVTPLMPVLHSPWLSFHVSLVMLSYALFIIVGVIASWGLTGHREEAAAQCRKLLRPAVWLLGLGIFSGAVWANESWGRYWGWDPKETWALITFMLYAVPLHLRRPSLWWYVVPLLSVAMTYFGVNFLPSLHAYS